MADIEPKQHDELTADVEAATTSHAGLAGRIRNYFLTGLVVAGPLLITAYLTWSFINWVDNLVRPFIPPVYRPETYLPWPIPGTGLIVAFVALTLLGFLTANLVGRTLVGWGESRIPDSLPSQLHGQRNRRLSGLAYQSLLLLTTSYPPPLTGSPLLLHHQAMVV